MAAFAGATFGRLLVVQLIVAFLAAATVGGFIRSNWFPVVLSAIQGLPPEGKIVDGRLIWNGESPLELAENRFLGLAVDLKHTGELGREAHLQIEFGRDDFRVYSILGYEEFPYPARARIACNRVALEPWWGAWQPWILVGAMGLVMAALMISWAGLATIYCPLVRVLSFLENRDLDWHQSWLLSGAAMMPGVLFLTAGIACYALGWMDLIRLGALFGMHFVVGWIYLIVSPFFCPRTPVSKKQKENPFAASGPK